MCVLGNSLGSPGGAEIILNAVTAGYGVRPAISNISGSFEQGSLTAIAGPNGAGKSTLMKIMAGALKPSTGTVSVNSTSHLAYLPQRSSIDQSFPISVLDTVLLGHCRRDGWHRRFAAAARNAAFQALERVGLEALAARSVATLSAGQFQRTLFARLIVEDARLILLDEPFNAVDTRTVADLLNLVQSWQQDGRTIIAVLHDLAQIRSYFPRTLLLAQEVVDWGPTDRVLTPDNLACALRMTEGWDKRDNGNPLRLHV